MSFSGHGRGKHYTPARARAERWCSRFWGDGWGARLWSKFPGALRVRAVEHRLGFGRARPALRIAFLSDLHVGPTTPRELLNNAVSLANAFEPDVVLLGGDYVFLEADAGKVLELERLVGALRARTKIAVFGNHDLWADHAQIERALVRSGARVCVNQAVLLAPPHDDVAVFGLDEPWTGEPSGAESVRACGDATLKLALAHSPDGIAEIAGHGFRLLLCGHTHGGHIALPGGRPIVLPPGPYSKKLAWGLHRVGELDVFVSRGLGATEIPMRLFAPPDIGLFTLV